MLISDANYSVKEKHLSTCGGRGRNGEAVLHVVYKDGECGAKWGQALNSWPKEMADQEIHCALGEYMFNMTIPKSLDTIYQYWDKLAVIAFESMNLIGCAIFNL